MNQRVDETHELQVAAVEHGTVVDHLNPGTALKCLEILGVPRDGAALLGMHLASGKLGRKDILKLANVEISQEDIDRIALFGPQATVSFIRNYRVERKVQVRLPEKIRGILKCPNPSCITNHETVTTAFKVISQRPMLLRCDYCERRILDSEVHLI